MTVQAQSSEFSPQLRLILRVIQVFSAFGLALSIVRLAGESALHTDGLLLLYTSWFVLAIVSAEAILYRIRAGVLTLVAATSVVMVAEFASGTASLGGASLGLLIGFILWVYIRPLWRTFD